MNIFINKGIIQNYLRSYIILLTVQLPVINSAQNNSLPWLNKITHGQNINAIQSISSKADVTVSDGLNYKTFTVYHDPQRAVFKRIYEDRTITQGVDGKYIWSFEGTAEKEVPEFIENIVLGHQFHAQILFYDKLHPDLREPVADKFNDQECIVLVENKEDSGNKFYYSQTGYPLGIEVFRKDEANIIFKYDDWRDVSGIELPFLVTIDDGSRQFQYTFRDIKFDDNSTAEFRAPEEVLTDEQKILRMHRTIMDGHFFGLTDDMKSQQFETMDMLSDGEIYTVKGNQPEAMIDRIMAARDYTVYDDLIRPKIEFSDDSTLAWLIAHVYAKGVRYDENKNETGELEFTCSWIELYKKIENQWKMMGNVSTFKPGRK